jgi:hypothetical protein
MRSNNINSLVNLISVLLFFCLASCIQEVEEVRPRNENIPINAIWIGGSDGGVYAVVTKLNNSFGAEIYDERGNIAYKGKMKHISDNKMLFDYRNPKSYIGWDGDVMYLINQQSLIIEE